MRKQGSGWHGESRRHSLARKGIKTAKGRIVTKQYEVFKFDELPEDIQQKILDNYWDINTNWEWWEQDGLLDLSKAEMDAIKVQLSDEWWNSTKPKDKRGNIIGEYPAHTGLIDYDINEFDIDYRNYIIYNNIEVNDEEVFRRFLRIPTNLWNNINYHFPLQNTRYASTTIDFDWEEKPFTKEEEKILNNAKDIFDNKVSESIQMLKEQYEYLSSKEGILETIEANNYEFTKDGKIFG